MANLDDIISITVDIEDTSPTQQGFGTPLIAAYHTRTDNIVDTYSSISAMVEDGFVSSDNAYKAASIVFSQVPRVPLIKIGRRSDSVSQVLKITPTVEAAASRLGAETLSEITFATHALWNVTGDFVDSGGNATWTHSAGTGTLTQPSASLATPAVGSRWYRFNYAVSGVTGTVAASITTAFAATSTSLTLTNGSQTTYFLSAVTPGDFVISGTSSAGGAYVLDNVSLMPLDEATFSVEVEGQVASLTSSGLIATVLTDLATAINGLTASNVTAVSTAGTHLVVTSAAGTIYDYTDWSDNLEVEDISTAGASLEDDLDAFLIADNDWFGLALDSNSPADIAIAAAWAEANGKLFFADMSDSTILDPAETSDPLSDLQALGYHNTIIVVRKTSGNQYAGAAWMGVGFAYEPGEITWAHKQLAGVATDDFSDSDISTIKDKGGNYYVDRNSIGDIMEGWAVSGRFIDLTHGSYWFRARLQEYTYALLTSSLKIPYSDAGFVAIESRIWEVIGLGIENNFFVDSPAPIVRMPLLVDVPTIDKAARILRDIEVEVYLAGAIHRLVMGVTLKL